MGSTPESLKDSLEPLTRDSIEISINEMKKIEKVLQFVKQCAELKRTEQSVVILQLEVDQEINECYQKINRCRLLQLQLGEAVCDGRLSEIYISICESLVQIRINFESRVRRQYQQRIPEGVKKLKEFEDLAPLRLPARKWVKKMLGEDPDALVKQLEECKSKVDAGHKFFQELKQEMESSKEFAHMNIDTAIHMSDSLLRLSRGGPH